MREACQAFDEALRHFPNDVAFNKAVALDTMWRLDEARQSYEQCLVLDLTQMPITTSQCS
ncbi:hypothetical protein YK56LOC_68090 [Caballeronia sp. HLA56]